VKAYEADFRHFTEWCDAHQLQALPADAATLSLYLTHLASKYRPSTINRRLASISVCHKRHGYRSPTGDPVVQEVAKGIRRVLGVKPDEAKPITTGDLRLMIAHIPDDVAGYRDRAVLLVGFAGALRRSEIVGANVEDLEQRPEGLVLHLRRSKTDQQGEGRQVALLYGVDAHTCPVTAVEKWRTAGDVSTGALFRSVDRHGNVSSARLTGQAVNLIVRKCAARAKMETSRLSGHSLRSGFATSAAANGATESSIMRQTGHRSTAMLRRYVRHASVFSDNAVSRIGL
jgi:integrase